MDSKTALSELKISIDSHSSINAVAKRLQVNRSVLYRNFAGGDMQLSRFLDILRTVDSTPARFFAAAEGYSIVEGNLMEIEFKLQSAQLEVDFLKKKLAECEAKSKG